jgi:hypothetical protein
MPSDPRKRQKKLERRAAKRKEKQRDLVRQQSAGIAERLRTASRCPVLHCWLPANMEEMGMGWVVLSRVLPNGQIAVANFLVDSFCLGVKDVFLEVLSRSAYDDKYVRDMAARLPTYPASPADARKYLDQAVAFARACGLPPHADYSRGLVLFGDVDPSESSAEFVFGKNGKPLFVNGPNDSPARCRQILATLEHTLGPGNYDHVMMVGRENARLFGMDEEYDEIEEDEE